MKNKTVLALLLIVMAVYANSLFSGFVWDDKALIIKKQAFFSDPANVIQILTSSDAPLGVKNPYYRPLNTLTYMFDHYLWGLHPFWYHLENFLLHALVVTLFYFLLVKVFKDGRLAFIATLLFAVYPVNAEAVDLVSARNTLLCAAFSLCSLLFLFNGGFKRTVLPLFAYFFALLSKEPAVVLPFFLLSLRFTSKDNKLKIKNNILISFFGVTALYFILRYLVLGTFTSKSGVELSPERLKFIASVYFEHFRLMIFPFRLNANYTAKWLSFNWVKASGAVLGILFLLSFSFLKKTPEPVRAGSQWILWGLLPVSNIINIPSGPVAERYQYTILSGFVLIIGYFFSWLQKRRTLAGTVMVSALALLLCAKTFERNFVWRNDMSLYSSMVRSDPQNAKAHCNLGAVYAGQGNLDQAIREFKAALVCRPSLTEARLNLGVTYAREGRLEAAAAEFQNVLKWDPGNASALEYLNKIRGGL